MPTTVPFAASSQWSEASVVKQSIYETSSTALARLGTRAVTGDGRVFRYAKAGASDIAAGVLCQGPAPFPNHKNIAVYAAASVGDTQITVTLGNTPVTANYYAEGYLHANDNAPEGNIYKIKSHPSANANATLTLTLYDPIIEAFTTSSEVTLTKNPYDAIVIAPNGGLTQVPVGVPIVDIAAGYYGWVQTWGPCPVLTQGTVVIGQNVGLGGTTDGAVGPIGAYTTAVVGWTQQVNASTEFSLIYLTIAP